MEFVSHIADKESIIKLTREKKYRHKTKQQADKTRNVNRREIEINKFYRVVNVTDSNGDVLLRSLIISIK